MALLRSEADRDDAPRPVKRVQPVGYGFWGLRPGCDLVGRERPQIAQEIRDAVSVSRLAVVDEMLQLQFDFGEGVGLEQLAELRIAQQLAQQRAVQSECGSPLLGNGCVVLVHERGDEVEHQRRGERARALERHVSDPDRSSPDLSQDLGERRQIEVILEDLPVGLEHDRERAVALGNRQQIGRLAALEPQRRARTRPPAGEQQRTSCGFAEP